VTVTSVSPTPFFSFHMIKFLPFLFSHHMKSAVGGVDFRPRYRTVFFDVFGFLLSCLSYSPIFFLWDSSLGGAGAGGFVSRPPFFPTGDQPRLIPPTLDLKESPPNVAFRGSERAPRFLLFSTPASLFSLLVFPPPDWFFFDA